MSEDNLSQGNDADIASRIAALDAAEDSPADEGSQDPQPDPESEEVVPASEANEAEQGAQTETAAAEGADEAPEDDEQFELPEGSNPRTKKAFDRLLANNRKLKERLKGAPGQQPQPDVPEGSSVFDSIYGRSGQADQGVPPAQMPQGYEHVTNAANYQGLNQQQVNTITQQFMRQDQQTGEVTVDAEGLVGALLQENQRAVAQAQAQTRQTIARYEEKEQVREAHGSHPYLNPTDKSFDRRFYDLVRVHMYDSLVNNDGRSFKQVADHVAKNVYNPAKENVNVSKEREEAVSQYKASQETRRAAQPAQRGRAQRQQTTAELQELRQRTRSANAHEAEAATMERLKRLGI